jgi:O-antigen/teichoic acid export membrane protein
MEASEALESALAFSDNCAIPNTPHQGGGQGMRDGQRVALNAAVMFVKQGVMAVLGVVFIGYLARKVGVAAWGEFQASIAIASVVTVIAGIGVRGYLGREVAISPEHGAHHLGTALLIRGVTGTVLLGGTVAIALGMRTGEGAILLVLASVTQLASLLYSTMWLSFEAHERFQYILYVELASRVFVIGVASAALALGYGVIAAAVAFMLGNLLELTLTYYFIRTRLYRPVFDAKASELWSIAKLSLPIGMLGAISGALQQSDRVLLRFFADEAAVGIYSAAWVLSDNFTMIADVFLGAAFAAGMRLYARDQQAFGRLYQGCMFVAAMLGLPIAAGVYLLAPEIIGLVYGARGDYAASSTVLRILACQVPVSFAFMVGTLPLMAAKRERALAKLLTCSLVANVALNVLLIPRLGAVGSALATLFVSTGSLVASWSLASTWLRTVELRRIGATAGATLGMSAGAYVALGLGGMWAAIGAAVPIYVALLLALRAVTWPELCELVRRRVPSDDAGTGGGVARPECA